MEKTECWKCKYLIKSIYMKLENETLYNCWCDVGNVGNEKCDKFESCENTDI